MNPHEVDRLCAEATELLRVVTAKCPRHDLGSFVPAFVHESHGSYSQTIKAGGAEIGGGWVLKMGLREWSAETVALPADRIWAIACVDTEQRLVSVPWEVAPSTALGGEA